MKKIAYLGMMLVFVCVAIFGVTGLSIAKTSEPSAIFVEDTVFSWNEGKTVITVSILFSQELKAASGTTTLSKYDEKIFFNEKSLKSLMEKETNIVVAFPTVENKTKTITIAFPSSSTAFLGDGTDNLLIKMGVLTDTNFITTVEYIFYYKADGSSRRNYRMSEDLYKETKLISISAPKKMAGIKQNMLFTLYFSNELSTRKLVNMEFWYEREFIGLMLPEYPFSKTEVDTYFNFGIVGVDNRDSLLYKMQVGATKFNGLKVTGKNMTLDCEDTVKGTEIYSLKNLMLSTGGAVSSELLLSVQMHLNGTIMEFAFKGDSDEDCFNLAPDSPRDMPIVIRLKKGMLFPTGVMIKEDVTYYWDNLRETWTNLNNDSGEIVDAVDDTLNNQGGYTDAELAEMGGNK